MSIISRNMRLYTPIQTYSDARQMLLQVNILRISNFQNFFKKIPPFKKPEKAKYFSRKQILEKKTSSLPENFCLLCLLERHCSLLQVYLNLTNTFSLPSFLYNPFRASYIYYKFDKRVFVHQCQYFSLLRCPYL